MVRKMKLKKPFRLRGLTTTHTTTSLQFGPRLCMCRVSPHEGFPRLCISESCSTPDLQPERASGHRATFRATRLRHRASNPGLPLRAMGSPAINGGHQWKTPLRFHPRFDHGFAPMAPAPHLHPQAKRRELPAATLEGQRPLAA